MQTGGVSGRSLFHQSEEALSFICFFLLPATPFIAAGHINDASAQVIRKCKQTEPGFL